MNEETIVAVYDTASQVEAAIRELQDSGIPPDSISRHSAGTTAGTAPQPPREQGFWSALFGGVPDYDTNVYDKTMAAGSHVVTVKVDSNHATSATTILERHDPIDIDERATAYGLGRAGGGRTDPRPQGTAGATGTARAGAKGEEKLQLAEEQLNVGKRLVNHGTTRIRRYVVETPVEENVSLHSEHVTVERRPASGETRVDSPDFTDRTIEVSETEEEAVVGKTARVREEVVVRKDASDRVETVRDTVRREDVEITKDGQTQAATDRPAGPTPHRPR